MSNALEQKWVPSWPTSSLAHPISARCPPSRSPSFLPTSPPRCPTELHVHSFSTSALIHVRAPPSQVISRFPMANPQKCQTFLQIAQPYINISISSILDSNFSSIQGPSRRQSSLEANSSHTDHVFARLVLDVDRHLCQLCRLLPSLRKDFINVDLFSSTIRLLCQPSLFPTPLS